MFQQLKMALRKQRRLLLTFLLTIFLPSVTLSVFGLIALHNERFRLERQFREEQLTLIDSIKSQVGQQIGTIERELLSIVRTIPFENRRYDEMLALVEQYQRKYPLSDQFFVVYDEYEPWFPPLRGPGSGYIQTPERRLSSREQLILGQAETLEFIQKDYTSAIRLLQGLLNSESDTNLQAQVLNLLGRNRMKQGDFNQAIETYTSIIEHLPNARTSSGTLLPVTVRFQLIDCYLESGLPEQALEVSLDAYATVNDHYHLLSEDQLSAYASLAQDKFTSILLEYPERFSGDSTYLTVIENLNSQYQRYTSRWRLINNLKQECIPEISDTRDRSFGYGEQVSRFMNRLGNEDNLILYCQIPGPPEQPWQGIAGIKLNSSFLEDTLLFGILSEFHQDLQTSLQVTNLSGRLIYGNGTADPDALGISSLFEGSFPPWQISISGHPSGSFIRQNIIKSYYFWTILVMVMILVFGVSITGRIIAHEREVLKIKSDFVSSVSHEFKTPITSIAALTERLLEGGVKDPGRMKEYYERIAQDAANLGHLVENILDFSKMEEGGKVYLFEEIQPEKWLQDTLAEFFKKHTERKYKFRILSADGSIPLQMDRNAMLLAIYNLLDNAIKFSSTQSEIAVILEQQPGQYRIDISDEGIGIPIEEQSRIFEKFYRGPHASEYAATGTGLGLAIVKQIVSAHGGSIQVESSPGSGSTFKIILPCKNPRIH